MKTHNRYIAALALLLLTPFASASVVVSNPFRGIALYHRTETLPRALQINIAKIDLTDPGISFRVTAPNGDLPNETTRQTTREFLTEQKAQLAINTSFFDASAYPYTDNIGFAASDGVVYSTFQYNWPAMNISSANVPTIIRQLAGDVTGVATNPSLTPYNAFSGNEQIVTAGVRTAGDTNLHPRTAVGITADQHLILFTVDGRQTGISEGMTTLEIADMLIADYGVINALNLDGGGSTTFAIADTGPRLLNVPVGILNVPGSERPNGQNLAVFAAPIPEPMSVAAVGLCVMAGLVIRETRNRRN